MRVLITDGNCRSALAATRSLGNKGIDVVVSESFNYNLSSSSRYCKKNYVCPSPYVQPEEFLNAIQRIIDTESIDLIFPMTDISMELILANSSRFRKNMLHALPSYSSYMVLTDKINLLKLASKLNLLIPESIFIENKRDLLNAINTINFPVIIKPARSRLFYEGKYLATSVSYAESEDQLLNIYERTNYLKKPFIIQKIVSGHGAGLFTLFNHGRPVVYFCHKRLRERPPSGGVSVVCESIPVDENLRDIAEKLLTAVNWHGIAMVEFKIDDKTNTPYLMEVNGRFWGSLQLAIDSGVDFPYLLFLQSMNSFVGEKLTYQMGRKSRWLLGDIDYLYLRLFKKTGNEGLPANFSAKVRAIYDVMRFNGLLCNFDVLRLDDIKPFLTELKQYINGNHG